MHALACLFLIVPVCGSVGTDPARPAQNCNILLEMRVEIGGRQWKSSSATPVQPGGEVTPYHRAHCGCEAHIEMYCNRGDVSCKTTLLTQIAGGSVESAIIPPQ